LKNGAFADMLILDKNPLDDIEILGKLNQHCFAIIKEGRVVMSKVVGLTKDEIYS
jgi:imidazolonepropionase-like amidohydrolase